MHTVSNANRKPIYNIYFGHKNVYEYIFVNVFTLLSKLCCPANRIPIHSIYFGHLKHFCISWCDWTVLEILSVALDDSKKVHGSFH